MKKVLDVVQETRKAHKCLECGQVIRKYHTALAMILTDEYGKSIGYFCGWECYNNREAREGRAQ